MAKCKKKILVGWTPKTLLEYRIMMYDKDKTFPLTLGKYKKCLHVQLR